MALGQFGDVVDLRSDEVEVDVAAGEAPTVDLTGTTAPMEEGAA